jgi:hypothetical protein
MRPREIAKFHCRKYLGLIRTRFLKNIEGFFAKTQRMGFGPGPYSRTNQARRCLGSAVTFVWSFCIIGRLLVYSLTVL